MALVHIGRHPMLDAGDVVPPPPLKKVKRVHPWRREYARDFGTCVVQRDAASGAVLVVECRFCAAFGREERSSGDGEFDHDQRVESGRERKARARSRSVATWKRSFRSDNMRSHHAEQHPRKWREYRELLALVEKEAALEGSDALKGPQQRRDLPYTKQLAAFFGDGHEMEDAEEGVEATEGAEAPVKQSSKALTRVATSRARKPPSAGSRRWKATASRLKAAVQVAPTERLTVETAPSPPATSSVGFTDVAATTTITVAAAGDESTTERPPSTSPASPDTVRLAAEPSPSVSVLTVRNAAIVDELLPTLFGDARLQRVRPHDANPTTAAARLALHATDDTTSDGTTVSAYSVTLEYPNEYAYVQQVLALADATLSFQQIASIVRLTRTQFRLQSVLADSVSESSVREYGELAVATNLQRLSDRMRASWAYSLALVCVHHTPMSRTRTSSPSSGGHDRDTAAEHVAIDVCLRLPAHRGTDVDEFHLITLFGSRAQADMSAAAETILQTLRVLDTNWQQKLVGVCDNGPICCSTEIVAQLVGVVRAAVTTAPFYHAWRGAELVEAALWRSITTSFSVRPASGSRDHVDGDTDSGDGLFDTISAVTEHLRAQLEWTKVHGVCPWLHEQQRSSPWQLQRSLQWLNGRREAIDHMLSSERESSLKSPVAVSPRRWVVWLALADILSDLEPVHRALQDPQAASAAEPRKTLSRLVRDQARKIGVSIADTISEEQSEGTECAADDSFIRSKRLAWGKDRVVAYFRSLNLSTRRLFAQLSPVEQMGVVTEFGSFVLCALNSLVELTVSDSDSDRAKSVDGGVPVDERLPPTRPLDFAAIERDAVVDFVELHSARLELSFDLAFIDAISKEVKDLRELVTTHPSLRARLDAMRAKPFREAWEPVADAAFPSTRILAAGFATASRDSLGASVSRQSRLCAELLGPRPGLASREAEARAHAQQLQRAMSTSSVYP